MPLTIASISSGVKARDGLAVFRVKAPHTCYHLYRLACPQVEQLDDGLIFYLATLPSATFAVAAIIFQLYSKGKLKGQKVPRSKKNVQSSPLDLKGSNFRCLRGVPENSVHELLTEVKEGKLTLQELSSECHSIKQLAKIQVGFMKATNSNSWEEAQEQFPEFTTSEKLEPFKRLSFTGSTLPEQFMTFCRAAMKYQKGSKDPTDAKEADNMFVIQHQSHLGVFWKMDIFAVNGDNLSKVLEKVCSLYTIEMHAHYIPNKMQFGHVTIFFHPSIFSLFVRVTSLVEYQRPFLGSHLQYLIFLTGKLLNHGILR